MCGFRLDISWKMAFRLFWPQTVYIFASVSMEEDSKTHDLLPEDGSSAVFSYFWDFIIAWKEKKKKKKDFFSPFPLVLSCVKTAGRRHFPTIQLVPFQTGYKFESNTWVRSKINWGAMNHTQGNLHLFLHLLHHISNTVGCGLYY